MLVYIVVCEFSQSIIFFMFSSCLPEKGIAQSYGDPYI